MVLINSREGRLECKCAGSMTEIVSDIAIGLYTIYKQFCEKDGAGEMFIELLKDSIEFLTADEEEEEHMLNDEEEEEHMLNDEEEEEHMLNDALDELAEVAAKDTDLLTRVYESLDPELQAEFLKKVVNKK